MERTLSDTLDVSLHVIPFEGNALIYDARSFSIVEAPALVGVVASRVAEMPLAKIVDELVPAHEPEEIVRAYVTIRNLRDAGVFATKEPDAPGLPGLRSLTLLLAGGCNMGCHYCFEADKPTYQKLNLLSPERADAILDWFAANHRHRHMHLQLYGGEPLLNWPVLVQVVNRFKAIAQERNKTSSIYMITNGTMLSEERCDFLVRSGVEIQISLDGNPEENKHRVFKGGKETFSRVSPWIKYLSSIGANFNVRAVLTPTNPDPERAISALERLGAEAATYGVVSTSKEWLRFDSQGRESLRAAQFDHIESRMDRWLKGEGRSVVPANVRALARRIDQGSQIHYHCNAGVTEVTVTHEGAIYECQRLMGTSKVTIDSPDFYESVKSFLTPVAQKAKCATCFARYNCGGGCKEANVLETGEDHAWPEYCAVKRKEVEAAIVLSFTTSNKNT